MTKYFVYIFSNATRLNEIFFRKSDVSRNFDLLRPAGPLKAKRDSKVRRKARQSAAQSQSDQSVYDTDTEVPSIDEPIPSVQVQSDKVESVVSEAPSAEASLSDFFICDPR